MSASAVLDDVSDVDRVRMLFKQIVALHDDVIEPEQAVQLCKICSDLEAWRRLISAIPFDKSSFQLVAGIQRVDAIRLLSEWCRNFPGGGSAGADDRAAEIHGFLSVLLITLITMEEGGSSPGGSRAEPLDGEPGELADTRGTHPHSCARICQVLLKRPSVRSAVLSLYAPDHPCPVPTSATVPGEQKDPIESWGRLQHDSLSFHRHGSTSFILRGRAALSMGKRPSFALKCVLLPYANVPAIASKTESYAFDHDALNENMAPVWASTKRWILMDFVDGVTLSEEIEYLKRNPFAPRDKRKRRARRVVPAAGNVRLDLIRTLGLPLLGALSELYRAGKLHEDLSPTNIIVERRVDPSGRYYYDVVFIDFGRNYLHTGVAGGQGRPDATFVAPEVAGNEDEVPRADIYSLGQILIALGDVGQNRDGTIPDRFYGQAPLIARVIEDLIDRDPERRLLIFGTTSEGNDTSGENGNVYERFQEVLKQELDVTQAELEPDSGRREYAVPRAKESLSTSIASLSHSLESQKRQRIYNVRKEQGVLSEPRRSMYARWLLIFSRAAAFNYFITATVCILWFWRDLGLDVLPPPVQAGLSLVGVDSTGVPLIDDLRQPDYQLGEVMENLPARVIGLSFALAGARYYQNIFSGLTTMVARSPSLGGAALSIGTEVAMRTMAIWSSWLILGANLMQVRWWTMATAIGYTGVLVVNVLTARFAIKYLTMARNAGLSTLPPPHQQITGLGGFRQWGPSMFFFSSLVWVFAVCIDLGLFKDVLVYATLVAVVNIGMFYVIKGGSNSLDIRTGLNRCFLAAERLRAGREQGVI